MGYRLWKGRLHWGSMETDNNYHVLYCPMLYLPLTEAMLRRTHTYRSCFAAFTKTDLRCNFPLWVNHFVQQTIWMTQQPFLIVTRVNQSCTVIKILQMTIGQHFKGLFKVTQRARGNSKTELPIYLTRSNNKRYRIWKLKGNIRSCPLWAGPEWCLMAPNCKLPLTIVIIK